MEPANPPLPTARKRPFQPSAGIHNSTLMRESSVGVRTIRTRQCAGMGSGVPPRPPRPPPPGRTKGPSGAMSADVIAPFSIVNDVRLSHGVV